MSAQDTGAGATNLDEELGLDQLPEGIDDPLILRDRVNKLENAKRQLTARAKKAEEEARTLKEAQPSKPDSVTSVSNSKPYEINDEVVDLRLDGYSKEEVAFLSDFAKARSTSLNDALKDPYIKSAIDTQREQHKAEMAASQTTDTAGQSEIERKYTPQQLAAMPLKELEALLPHAD